MHTNPKLDAAKEATSQIAAVVDDAMYELEYHFYEPLNAYGCHDHIKEVKQDMTTAIEKLRQALAMIDAFKWPDDEEYDDVLGEEGCYAFS